MIGLILTGHGGWASGMEEALSMIAGDLPSFAAYDFQLADSTEELRTRLERAHASMSDCDGVLVCCDLVSGSPFSTAVMTCYTKGAEVIAGSNLGMLLEINALRSSESDVHKLAEQAVDLIGKGAARFQMPKA